jgi:hypothetical protein
MSPFLVKFKCIQVYPAMMSEIKKNDKSTNTINRKLWIKSIIFILILLISLTNIPNNSTAMDAEVIATLDVHNLEHKLSTNVTNHLYISGNISCQIDGLGGNIQRVEVELWVSSSKWDGSIGPSHMTFVSNGKKPFNLTISISTSAKNNSRDTFFIQGHWQTEPYHSGLIGGKDDIIHDSINVTIRRQGFVRGPQTTTPEFEEIDPWWEEMGLPNILVIILILSLIIASVGVYYYRRKKYRLS